jgi:hypothetical protein
MSMSEKNRGMGEIINPLTSKPFKKEDTGLTVGSEIILAKEKDLSLLNKEKISLPENPKETLSKIGALVRQQYLERNNPSNIQRLLLGEQEKNEKPVESLPEKVNRIISLPKQNLNLKEVDVQQDRENPNDYYDFSPDLVSKVRKQHEAKLFILTSANQNDINTGYLGDLLKAAGIDIKDPLYANLTSINSGQVDLDNYFYHPVKDEI